MKIVNALVTSAEVNTMLDPLTTAPVGTNRCVVKDQSFTGATVGTIGVNNNWRVDQTASPYSTYTNNRLPRFQDLIPLPYKYKCGDGLITRGYAGNDYYIYPNMPIDDTVYPRVQLNWVANDRPNVFSVYDSNGLVYTTGWVGVANYSGPWGTSLNAPTNGNIIFNFSSYTGRYIQVQAGPGNPSSPTTDSFSYSIDCLPPVTPLTPTVATYCVAYGTTCTGSVSITNITGGYGSPYQTSFVPLGSARDWKNYPAISSYTNVCVGSYELAIKDSFGTIVDLGISMQQCPPPTTTTTSTTAYTCGVNVTGSYAGTDYYLYPKQMVSGTSSVCNQFNWQVNDRPNRFTIGDSTGQIFTTGWVGFANYNGPWGSSLNTPLYGYVNFSWASVSGRYIQVEAGPADPASPITDSYLWNSGCATCTTTTTCNPTANYVETGTYSCYGTCNKYNIMKDINPCSPTYNQTKQGSVILPLNNTFCGGCCGQDTNPSWIYNGTATCSGCSLIQPQIDNNPCSSTYNQTRNLDLGTTNSCGVWNINYYCAGCDYYQREVNSCTGSIRNVVLVKSNSVSCGGCCGQSTVANWQNVGFACQGCDKYDFQRDTNPCSSTYNQSRFGTIVETNSAYCYVSYQNCCGQSTSANWVNNGTAFCSSCNLLQPQIDNNFCSTTYNTTQNVNLGSNSDCGTWVFEYYCQGCDKYSRDRNTCTDASRNVTLVQTNSTYCGCGCYTYNIYGYNGGQTVTGTYTNCSGSSANFSFTPSSPGFAGSICIRGGTPVTITSGNGYSTNTNVSC